MNSYLVITCFILLTILLITSFACTLRALKVAISCLNKRSEGMAERGLLPKPIIFKPLWVLKHWRELL